MSKFITGEQFEKGLINVATKIDSKINSLEENSQKHANKAIIDNIGASEDGNLTYCGLEVQKNTYDISKAHIVSGLFSKENSLLCQYDFDKQGDELYVPDQINNINPSLKMTAPPLFEFDEELQRKVAVFNGKSFVPMGTFAKTSKFTLSTLVKKDNWKPTVIQRLYSCAESGGYHLTFNANGAIVAYIYKGTSYISVTSSLNMSDMSPGWHLITFAYDGFKLSLHIDYDVVDEVVISETLHVPVYHSSNGVFLGVEAGASQTTPQATNPNYLEGKVAEVRVFNRGLGREEILEVHRDMWHHVPIDRVGSINVKGDYHNHIIINDMSNPLTMNPLEYGTFGLVQNLNNPTLNSYIKLDKTISGNLQYTDDGIKLKGGSTYKIDTNIFTNGTGFTIVYGTLVDVVTKEETMLLPIYPLPNSNNDATVSLPSTSHIFDISNDCYFKLKITYLTGSVTFVNKDFTYLTIQEVRNNPVAQYGGFETEVLFDGKADSAGDYMLADSIDNYNLLMIQKFSKREKALNIEMTSDTTPAPYVVTTSSILGTHMAGWKAFCKTTVSETDCWHSAGGNSQWISIKLDKERVLQKYTIKARANTSFIYPIQTIKLLGSNDGSIYEEIATTNFNSWGAGQTKEAILQTDTPYLYYKWEILASGGYAAVGYIELFEKLYEPLVEESIYLSTENANMYNEKFDFSISKNKLTQSANSSINKIIGIKGQLPSLLVGGEF